MNQHIWHYTHESNEENDGRKVVMISDGIYAELLDAVAALVADKSEYSELTEDQIEWEELELNPHAAVQSGGAEVSLVGTIGPATVILSITRRNVL